MTDSAALLAVFNALPGAYLLLTPSLRIVAASDEYLSATLSQRSTLLDRNLFDAFPDNPAAPQARGGQRLRASLERVLATGQPHTMSPQHYDVPDPDVPGQFVERHWLPHNVPIRDAEGHITHLLHQVTNITDQVQHTAQARAREAAEQQAQAAAEIQRSRLHTLLTQAPALIASLGGPALIVEMANDGFRQMFGNRPLVGLPYRQAVPELAEQSFLELLETVYQTGETYNGREVAAGIDPTNSGTLETRYFNFIYQATHNAAGMVDGILIFAYDVSEQVLARQQVQQLNDYLATANIGLTASNAALSHTRQQVQQLNQQLEARVQQRTQQLETALGQSRQQREQLRTQQDHLRQIMGQVPASLATLSGPEHRYTFFNEAYHVLTGGRASLGQPVATVLPELAAQGFTRLLDEVYTTGRVQTGTAQPILLHNPVTGQAQQHFIDYIYQPLRNGQDEILGILAFILDVTERVTARQQAEYLQGEVLAATRRQVREREEFFQIFEHTPAAICIQRGPEHRYEYFNPAYQAFFPGRQLLGSTVAEALPETVDAGIVALLDQVYQTGETYFGYEVPLLVHQPDGHPPRQMYFTFTYQAYRENGEIVGISTVAYDVAGQVRLRQRVEAERAGALAASQQQVEERQMFYEIFEQTPALVQLLRGSNHRIAYVNPAYRALFPGQQLVGRPLAEVLPELHRQGFADLLDQVYQTGGIYVGAEVPLELAAPSAYAAGTHYFNFTYQAYRERGHVAGVSVFAYDVTEQVLARKHREQERQRLRTVFEQAPVAICVFDGPDYVLDVVNQPMSEMLGRPLAALLGQPFFRAMPELVDQGLLQLLDEVTRTGIPFVAREQEITLARHHPNEPGLFDFVYQPLRDEQGLVPAIICVATEVTTQVRARRMVEQREESFRLMADNAPAMLWVTDPNGYCTYLNQPWYAFTGQTEAEALGMGWVSAVHPDDAATAAAAFLEANQYHVPFHCLYRLRRHDGQYRWAIDSGQPRFAQNGEFAGIVGTVIDVHEQKLAELALQRLTQKLRLARDQARTLNTELQDANGQLVRTNVDLDNFIYTASHDLKAPITNIEGLVGLLREELPATGEAPHILGLMQDSVERFKRTIEHLTDVSRLQQEHDQPVGQVALGSVIEDVRLDLAPLHQQVGGRITVEVPAGATVRFSAKNLRSVIYNLLSNALKYHHPNRPPHVRIHYRTEDDYQVLEVHDNGLGLDLSRERQLFAMFQRLHTHVEGSGIGLYMVKRMVENVGGKIAVQSQLNAGSTFLIYFKR